MWITLFVAIAFLIHILWIQISYAAVPRILSYQLRLTDSSGIPVADGTVDIIISIYDAASGGSRVHTDCGTVGTPTSRKVVFTNGVGSVLIGDTAASGTTNCSDGSAPNAIAATVFDSNARYLGITVEADAEMTPRKRIVAGAFALNSDKLDDLDTSSAGGTTAFVPVTDSSGLLTLTGNPTTTTAVITANSAAATSELLLDLKTSSTTVFKVDAEGDTTISGQTRVTGRASEVITGSIDPTASTAVVGVGTLFTTELAVGDLITVSGATRLITAITDNTNLTVDQAFTDLANDTSVDRLPSSFTLLDSSGVGRATMLSTGSLIAGRMFNSFSTPGSVSSGLQAIRPVESSGNLAATFYGAALFPGLNSTEPSVYPFTGGCSNMQLAGEGLLHINSSGTGQATIGGIGSQGRISAGCNPAFGNYGLVIGVSQSSKFEPYAVLSNFGQLGLRVPLADDDVYRILLDSNRGGTQPKISFGPGTSSALDVSIARTASGTLSIRNAANDADAAFTASSGTFSGAIAANGDSLTSDADLTVTPAGGDFILAGGVTFNVGGSGSDVAYNVIGDSTASASGSMDSDDDLYIEGNLEVDGSIIGTIAITADSLDYIDLEDTLDLDAALTLNQSTNTWTQNFTGDTTTGYTYNVNSLTSGVGVNLASSAAFSGNILLLSATAAATGDFIEITSSNASASARVINIDLDNGDTNNSVIVLTSDTTNDGGADTAKFTLTSNGNITTSGDLALNGGDLTASADLTITPAGGDVFFADAATLNIGGSGSDVAYNVIGDSTAGAGGTMTSDDDLYIEGNLEVDGTITGTISITADSLDFIDFEDTLDLDAALTLNQSTNTWTQNFAGTTTDGLTYNATALTTTGQLLVTNTTSNDWAGSSATGMFDFNLTTTASTALIAGNFIDISYAPTYSTNVTEQVSGNVLTITRDIGHTGTASGLTVDGDLISIVDKTNGSAGTVTSSADILQIDQQETTNTGSNIGLIRPDQTGGFFLYADVNSCTTCDFLIGPNGHVAVGATSVQNPKFFVQTDATVDTNIGVQFDLDTFTTAFTSAFLVDIDGLVDNNTGVQFRSDTTNLSGSDIFTVTHNGAYSSGTTLSGNVITAARTLTNSAGTLTVTGPALLVTEANITPSGSLTYSANLAEFTQSEDTSTGAVISATHAGTAGSGLILTANSFTTGVGINLSTTALTTGSGIRVTGGTAMTTNGELIDADMGAATAGNGVRIVTTGVYTGTGLQTVTANSATTGLGIAVSMTGLTTGSGIRVTGGTSMTTNGELLDLNMGAATAGTGILLSTTGVFTGTAGLIDINADSATSGFGINLSMAGITSGRGVHVEGGSSMTSSGRLISADMSTATDGFGLLVTGSGAYTGSGGMFSVINDSLQTGNAIRISNQSLTTGTTLSVTGGGVSMAAGGELIDLIMGAATAGNGVAITTTGVYTGTGLQTVTANSATTGLGIAVSMTGLTTGSGIRVTGGTAMTTNGELIDADMGAATAGNGVRVATTGVYTGTGLQTVTANSATTGLGIAVSMTGLTTGSGIRVTGGTSMGASGELLDLDLGAATNGGGVRVITTGVHSGVGLVSVTANSSTGGNLLDLSQTGITDGTTFQITGGSSMAAAGELVLLNAGSATDGAALVATTGGAYTGTDGFVRITANSASTGKLFVITADGLTSGRAVDVSSDALTTGNLAHFESIVSAAGTGYSGNFVNLTMDRTYQIDLGENHSGKMLNVNRAITTNTTTFDDFVSGASLQVDDTFTNTNATDGTGLRVSGAVGRLTRSGSAAASETLNISANLFELIDNDLTGAGFLTNSGHVLSIQQLDAGATGQMIFMDSETATGTQNVILIQTDVAANDDTAWRVRADGSTFADNAYTGTGADYAEYFKAGVNAIEKGTLVALNDAGLVVPATDAEKPIVGVVSTNPGFIGNNIEGANGTLEDNVDYALIGLTGQIPTFVSVAGGAIAPGDAIALSETAGVGVKTTEPGYVVGYALEGTEVDGKIMVYVHAGWYAGQDAIAGVSGFTALPTLSELSGAEYGVFTAIASSVGSWSLDGEGKLLAQEVVAEKLTTKEIAIDATEEKTSIGEGVITAGTTSLIIENSIAKTNSKIFITLYSAYDGAWWISSRENGKFTITLSKLYASDVHFEYMIVSVVDPALIEPEDEFISINQAAAMGVVAGVSDSEPTSDSQNESTEVIIDETPVVEDEPVVVEESGSNEEEIVPETIVEQGVVEDVPVIDEVAPEVVVSE